MVERIVVFGAGGHAKVVIDAIALQGKYEVALLADADPSLVGCMVQGYLICSEAEGLAALDEGISTAIIAIGGNAARRRVANLACEKGFRLATVIHPAAVVSHTATIGPGTLVMPGSVINADARVGMNTVINTGAVVEHDSIVGDHVHIAPSTTLCGGVHVGSGVLIGAGATVVPGVTIGMDALIGAGSTVLADIPAGACAVGSPCRILERKS